MIKFWVMIFWFLLFSNISWFLKNHRSISVHAGYEQFLSSLHLTMFLLESIIFLWQHWWRFVYEVHFTDLNAKIWFHKVICSDMISNFLNPILFRICIEKFNHQMHILIRISAQKLPRRRLEGGGATVFYVVVQRVRSILEYQIRHSDYINYSFDHSFKQCL